MIRFSQSLRHYWKNYINCNKATATRAEFWHNGLFQMAILSIIGAIKYYHVTLFYGDWFDGLFWFMFGLFLGVFMVGNISLAWRRSHDAGISGCWMLVPFAKIIIGAMPSKTKGNLYR
ncbi:MAG: DUF805 domain-containing protein [Alphaproteobacteria bacterium]